MSELKPEISSGQKFNPIWVVPVVAVLIGLYMVIHTKMTEGPQISIVFNTAEGLEAGKTKIRYRNVDIGLVEDVSLSDGMDKVVVTAKMDSGVRDMLREDTRFWVVRARIGAGSITGIGTLLSGAYIHLDPGIGKKKEGEFTGLEVPPLTPADAPGVRLELYSRHAGSLSAGDPILFNGFKVGRIEGVSFDSEQKEVRYDAFVDAPYNELVTTNSRFWNVSGISVSASTAGIEVSTGSLETILLGGVAFGSLPGSAPGEKAESGAVYKLANSFRELSEDPFRHGVDFIAKFEQSLRGLEPGAPVEYRGIQIGKVKRILLKQLAREHEVGEGNPIPVLIYLEPGRLGVEDTQASAELMQHTISTGVEHGLRANLQTGNLLTGKLFVSLDFYDNAEPASLTEFEGYTVIPTIPSGFGRLEQQVSTLLDKLNALPLDPLLTNASTAFGTLDGTLAALTETLGSLDVILEEGETRAIPAELNRTLAELRATLGNLSPDSAMGQSLSSSVFELNRTLRNLEELTRTLSEKPNALVFPTEVPADPIPEARAQ